MDVVFEGSLSKSWGLKDVLQAILSVPNVPFGLLRVSSPSTNLQGKVLVSNSSHIVGASSSFKTDRDSYDALRSILELKDGTFAYLDLVSEPFDLERSLFISLEQVLETIPNLPDNSTQVFDEKGLLDRIFGGETAQPAQESKYELSVAIPKSHVRKPVLESMKITIPEAPITQWNVLQPLSTEALAAVSATQGRDSRSSSLQPAMENEPVKTMSSMIPDFVHTPDEQRASFARLRTLPDMKQAQPGSPIKWLLSALGIN